MDRINRMEEKMAEKYDDNHWQNITISYLFASTWTAILVAVLHMTGVIG